MSYWGESFLRKLGGMIGPVIRVDNATLNFDKLMFARVLIEMKIHGSFPEEISITNENDDLIAQKVLYDWRPIIFVNIILNLGTYKRIVNNLLQTRRILVSCRSHLL